MKPLAAVTGAPARAWRWLLSDLAEAGRSTPRPLGLKQVPPRPYTTDRLFADLKGLGALGAVLAISAIIIAGATIAWGAGGFIFGSTFAVLAWFWQSRR